MQHYTGFINFTTKGGIEVSLQIRHIVSIAALTEGCVVTDIVKDEWTTSLTRQDVQRLCQQTSMTDVHNDT